MPADDSSNEDEPDINSMSDEELQRLVAERAEKDLSAAAKLQILLRLRRSAIRERWIGRILVSACLAVGVGGLIVGTIGLVQLDNFRDESTERRMNNCRDDREDAIAYNKALEEDVATIYVLAQGTTSRPPSELTLRLRDERVASIRSLYQKVRVCTPEAIREWDTTNRERGYEDKPVIPMEQPLPPRSE